MAVRQGYSALLCPACGEGNLWVSEGLLACRQCRSEFPATGGVHVLQGQQAEIPATPASAVAQTAFFPSEAGRRSQFRDLDLIVAQVLGTRNLPETLEIGAGGGAWTWGLANDARYQRVYASDISPSALAHLAQITEDTGTLILDSTPGALSVSQGSLDLVVGRSTLCREMDVDALLGRVLGWLKPGGAAIFLEPCLQGKIWAAFVMDTIRRFEAQNPGEPPSIAKVRGRKAPPRKALSQLAQLRLEGSTRQIMRGADGQSAVDERVFDMSALSTLGYDLGFSECYPIDQPQSGTPPLRRLRNTLDGLLGTEKAVLDRYVPLFEALEATFAALPEVAPVAPNLYFVFRK